jgi:hypothetical protein
MNCNSYTLVEKTYDSSRESSSLSAIQIVRPMTGPSTFALHGRDGASLSPR